MIYIHIYIYIYIYILDWTCRLNRQTCLAALHYPQQSGAALSRLFLQLDQHAGAEPGHGLGAVPGEGLVAAPGARLGPGPGAVRGTVLREGARASAVVQGPHENELRGGQEPHSVMMCRDHKKTHWKEDSSRIPATIHAT